MGDCVAVAQINNSLYHHGIKGQKWGVRRFQNPDGSLTTEGKLRYGRSGTKLVNDDGTLTDYGRYKYREALKPYLSDDKYLEDIDFLHVSGEQQYNDFKEKRDEVVNTGIIPKGMTLYRTTNYDESLDNHRKYAVINPTDHFAYDYVNNPDVLSNDTDSSVIKYKVKKDIKIASDDEVKDYMYSLHNYERLRKLEDGARYITQNKKLTIPLYEDPKDDGYARNALEYLHNTKLLNQRLSSLELDLNGAYDQASDYYSGTRYFSDNKNKVFNHFKNLGYDAIPDIEDGGLSSIMAPVIILNPKESLSVDSKFRNDDWTKYYKSRYEDKYKK